MTWAETLGAQGRSCLPSLGVRGDSALVLTTKAEEAGLLHRDGTGNRVQAAALVIVLDLL